MNRVVRSFLLVFIGAAAGGAVRAAAAPIRVGLHMETLLAGESSAEPHRLQSAFVDAGFEVTPLTMNDLADRNALAPGAFDVLVLPDAVHYPAHGKAALTNYLSNGGCLLAIGGYAFDRPIVIERKKWIEATPGQYRINTRYGRFGDFVRFEPEQIGVFDPAYPLKRIDRSARASGQHVITNDWVVDGPLEGYAAVALTGSNHPVFSDVYARWIPLVSSYDRFGRLRGAPGAMVHHFAGPYAGSSWAIFGVTNRNLFDTPESDRAVVSIVRALADRTYLHELQTNWMFYEPDEPVTVTVRLTNHSDRDRTLRVAFCLDDWTFDERSVPCARGTTKTLTAAIDRIPAKRRSDFHEVRVEVREGRRTIDELATAFVVRDESVVAGGPRVELRDNYFRIDDEPSFLTGTNNTGMMWYCPSENPLTWERDFAQMRDCGLRLLRVLHFSSFATGAYEGKPTNAPLDLKNPPEKMIRQTDAMVQLAQKHGLVFWLVLHDWMNVDLTDEELDAQREWNRFWVDRYKNVPGIIYDFQNEPWIHIDNRPATHARFNTWLEAKYGSIEKLRDAWRLGADDGRGFGDFKPVHDQSAPWNDVREHDIIAFKAHLLDRWTKANAEGVHAGDADALSTVGYLINMGPADKILGVEHTSFSNQHWYGPVHDFPLEFKLIDRRFAGKSFSLGEFGAQELHDARARGEDVPDPAVAIRRYLLTTHYALGLGASFTADWAWKDFQECIFPWGMIHAHDDVRKDHLLAYRNTGLFFKLLRPTYESPEVWLLVPDSHRLGAAFNRVHEALHTSVDGLMRCGVPFGVINERDIDGLPDSARAIVYPVPYCPDDATFEKIAAVAQRGVKLYISGDIAYDADRQRTRTGRFAKLGLTDPGEHAPLQPMNDPPPVQRSKRATFVPDAPEVKDAGQCAEAYAAFLGEIGLRHKPAASEGLRIMPLPARGGGEIVVAAHPQASAEHPIKTVLGDIDVALGEMGCAVIRTDDQGRLIAVEADRHVQRGEELKIDGPGHFMLASLDGRDIASSAQLLFIPFTDGSWTLARGEFAGKAAVEFGDIVHGRWKPLGRASLEHAAGSARVNVTQHLKLNLAVIAAPAEMDEAIAKVLELHLGASRADR